MSLRDAVAGFAEALRSDDFSQVRRVAQADLVHHHTQAKRAMLARYGIHRVGPRVTDVWWEIPAGAEDAPIGSVVRLPFRATLVTAADAIEPESLAAVGGSPQLLALAGRSLTVNYAGISFQRMPDGGWAKLGESGDGTRWTDAGCCPHGSPLALLMDGFHARVVSSTNARDGGRMHTVHLHNATKWPLVANLHRWPGPHPTRYAIRRSSPLEGVPIPPGWGIVLPLTRPADQLWTTVAVALLGESAAWTPGLPLVTAPGHPHPTTFCPGAESHVPQLLSGAQALIRMRTEAPLLEEVLVRITLDHPGTPGALTQIWALDDALTGVLEKKVWGNVQGNSVSADGGSATVYLVGADARKLLAVCGPVLRQLAPGATITLRTASGDHAAALA